VIGRDRICFPLRKLLLAGIISFLCLREERYSPVSSNILNLKNNARKIFNKSHFFGAERAGEKNAENDEKLVES